MRFTMGSSHSTPPPLVGINTREHGPVWVPKQPGQSKRDVYKCEQYWGPGRLLEERPHAYAGMGRGRMGGFVGYGGGYPDGHGGYPGEGERGYPGYPGGRVHGDMEDMPEWEGLRTKMNPGPGYPGVNGRLQTKLSPYGGHQGMDHRLQTRPMHLPDYNNNMPGMQTKYTPHGYRDPRTKGSPGYGMRGGGGGDGSPGLESIDMHSQPPEYTPHASTPHYPHGPLSPPRNMNNLHTGFQNAAAPPFSPPNSPLLPRHSPSPAPQRRRPLANYANTPMGAYTSPSSPTAAAPRRPSTSARINRAEPRDRHIGPSGNEWLRGDSFLDACRCTTNCTCRKGQRVLYRARRGKYGRTDAEDGDAGSETGREEGEIRYILKDDLGRDCGDHGACQPKSRGGRNGGDSDDSDEAGKKSQKKKEDKKRKQEEQQRNAQYTSLKEDLLSALDGRFEDIKVQVEQKEKDMEKEKLGKQEEREPLVMPYMAGHPAQNGFMMSGANGPGMGMPGNGPDLRGTGPNIFTAMDTQAYRHPGFGGPPQTGGGGGGGYGNAMGVNSMPPMQSMNPYLPADMQNPPPYRPVFSPDVSRGNVNFPGGGRWPNGPGRRPKWDDFDADTPPRRGGRRRADSPLSSSSSTSNGVDRRGM